VPRTRHRIDVDPTQIALRPCKTLVTEQVFQRMGKLFGSARRTLVVKADCTPNLVSGKKELLFFFALRLLVKDDARRTEDGPHDRYKHKQAYICEPVRLRSHVADDDCACWAFASVRKWARALHGIRLVARRRWKAGVGPKLGWITIH